MAQRKWELNPPTRLVAVLVWLKLDPTWAVLGFLFGVEEPASRRSTKDVLHTLEGLAPFSVEQRPARAQGRSLAKLIETSPALEVLIGSHEQRTRRPKGWEQQKPFYSGKKKMHTMKSQAAVSLEGRV